MANADNGAPRHHALNPARLLTVPAWRRPLLAAVFFAALFSLFFAPASLSNRLLAPQDATNYHLPHYRIHTLWNPDLMTGFPDVADPQEMNWYIPARLLSPFPGSWNPFVILAYVLAGLFTYLYAYRVTADPFASLCAGVIYSLSGFMTAHLGHTAIIHAAAWIPGMLWVSEKLLRERKARWILIGAAITSQCVLAGHPQVSLYGMMLVAAYILAGGLSARTNRFPYIAAGFSFLVLGVLLASIQILPSLALASLSQRARLSFPQFASFSLAPSDLILLLFPCLFGGAGAFFFDRISYFGPWNLPEIVPFVGLLPLALSLVALASSWRKWRTLFWSAAALLSLWAALGASTPLGRLTYSIPGLNSFRAQGRFVILLSISIAVLAASSLAALRAGRWSRPSRLASVLLVAALPVAAALVAVPALAPRLQAAAAAHGLNPVSFSLTGNRWIGLPVAGGFLLALVLALFQWKPGRRSVEFLFLASLIADLAAFGWFADWRYLSPTNTALQPPAGIASAARFLAGHQGRWLSIHGTTGSPREAPPDLSALWGLPAVGKYGPLMPSRYAELLQFSDDSLQAADWWNPQNRALDLVGARLIALGPDRPAPHTPFHGLLFPPGDLRLTLGSNCGANALTAHVALPHASPAASLGVVSWMACSTAIPQSSPVLSITLHASNGNTQTVLLKAGVDTAEWAAACPDVIPTLNHRPATVFSRFAVPRGGQTCFSQTYGSVLQLPAGPMKVQSLDFAWLSPVPGAIRLTSLVLSDGARPSADLRPQDFALSDPSHWRVFQSDDDLTVYENLRAQPRAWLVPDTLRLNPDAIRRAIQTSQLPGGRPFDPRALALVESAPPFHAPPDPHAAARVSAAAHTSLDIDTVSTQPAFLVLADFYFPGWRVLLNGVPTPIVRTNYIQRGVLLPSGRNHLHFTFRPPGLYPGLALTLLTAALSIALGFAAHRRGSL